MRKTELRADSDDNVEVTSFTASLTWEGGLWKGELQKIKWNEETMQFEDMIKWNEETMQFEEIEE